MISLLREKIEMQEGKEETMQKLLKLQGEIALLHSNHSTLLEQVTLKLAEMYLEDGEEPHTKPEDLVAVVSRQVELRMEREKQS